MSEQYRQNVEISDDMSNQHERQFKIQASHSQRVRRSHACVHSSTLGLVPVFFKKSNEIGYFDISLFMISLENGFLKQQPSDFTVEQMQLFARKFPSLERICSRCANDQDLRDLIGIETFNLSVCKSF